MKQSHRSYLVIWSFLCIVGLATPDAEAFSRGLASKVRLMQNNAYLERLARAQQSHDSGDYKTCVREATLALQHAATSDEKASPAHRLLASAYTKLGDKSSASAHLKWLSDHQATK